MANSLSVIVPAYNEEQTLKVLLSRLIQVLPDIHEIVIVDDGSTAGPQPRSRQSSQDHVSVRFTQFDETQGKTAAFRTGFAASTGDIMIIQDADLEYDREDIPSLIQLIITGKADVVYGSQFW